MCNLLRVWSQIMGESLKRWFFRGASLCRNVMCSGFQTRAFFLSVSLYINPFNAELNPICHLLVLLEDLTFMGPCTVSIFQYTCISNKTQRYTVYLYLETALHVSGGTSTHHQERI
jgi:hypothetical protein